MGLIRYLLSYKGFQSHGYWYLRDGGLTWLRALLVGPFVLIAFSTPIALLCFVRGKPDLFCNSIFICFRTLIAPCGGAALMQVWNLSAVRSDSPCPIR